MASGDLLYTFHPYQNEPPSTNFATLDLITAATGLRPVLDFDDTTDETAIGSGVLPAAYSGGGITVKVHGSMSGANVAKTMSFDVAIERIASAALLSGAGSDFAAANNANPTVHATADTEFSFTVAFTNGADMDSLAAGEPFRIKLTRDADGTTSTDNAVGDFQLLIVQITET